MAIAIVETIQAGQIGLSLPWSISNLPNMSGANVKLLITAPNAVSATQYTCTIPGSGAPYYTTAGSEFPAPGKYSAQFLYTNAGQKYYSEIGYINVLANLG